MISEIQFISSVECACQYTSYNLHNTDISVLCSDRTCHSVHLILQSLTICHKLCDSIETPLDC
jgi:hypothetical protein